MTAQLIDPRAWNPTGPHVGPDDDDLEMLAQGDLGSAVLALHRVGAAACETVARAPLPDEFALIESLAKAREQFAEPLVDTVSKQLGDRAYSDVLAKEIFDGAEHGAIMVYKACVAKAVAPPLAVQRAGLVYGVPPAAMGRYLSIAANPSAHPVALADAADRTLLGWAADVVKTEETPTKINKADPTLEEYNHSPFGQEHPKGRQGRFVAVMERPSEVVTDTPPRTATDAGLLARLRRLGYGEQVAPPVAVTEPVVQAPVATAVTPAPPTVRRKLRQRRRLRQLAPDTTQLAGPRLGLNLQTQLKLQAGLGTKLHGRMGQALAEQMEAQRAEDEVSFDVSDLTKEMMTARQDFTQYGRLPNDQPFAWAMSLADANAFYEAAPGDGSAHDPKWTFIGPLQDRLGDIHVFRDQDEHRPDKTHEMLLDSTVEASTSAPNTNMIKDERISVEELERAGVDRTDAKAVEEYAKGEGGYFEALARDETKGGVHNPMLLQHMMVAPSAKPGEHGVWYAVRKPPPGWSLYGKVEPPQMPAAAEMVIFDPIGEARGNPIGANYGGQTAKHYELDPNQAYEFYGRTLGMWDPDAGALIDRYYLRPTDVEDMNWSKPHDFGKATTLLERTQQRQSVRTEPRDATGRWTKGGFLTRVGVEAPVRQQVVTTTRVAAPTATVTPVAAPAAVTMKPTTIAPPKRQLRQRRRLRQVVAAEPTQLVGPQLDTKVDLKLSPQMQRTFQMAMQRLATEDPKPVGDFPMAVDDRALTKVLTWRQWGKFLADHLPYTMADGIDAKELSPRATEALLGKFRNRDADEVHERLRENIANQSSKEMLESRDIKRVRIGFGDDQRLAEFIQQIEDYMVSHPEIAHANLASVHHDVENQYDEVAVYFNATPIQPQVVIHMPEHLDENAPLTLTYLGKARRHDLFPHRSLAEGGSDLIDPDVSVYRADQIIYRARQV